MNSVELLKNTYAEAYRFIIEKDLLTIPLGKYELENGVYVNIEEYVTELRCNRKYESHRLYTDIQYMISGEELITLADVEQLSLSERYNSEKDVAFYTCSINGIDNYLRDGDFLIISPGVPHMPCVCVGLQNKVRKAVFKIPGHRRNDL